MRLIALLSLEFADCIDFKVKSKGADMPDPNWPENPDLNWIKKTDDELIAIINSDSMTVPNNMKYAARSELHARQTKKDKCMLRMTALILFLTIILVYAEFFHKAHPAPMAVPALNVQSQQLNPTEKKKTPQTKKDIPKIIITHSSTSTNQK